MDKEKAERITSLYNWFRFFIVLGFLLLVCLAAASAQEVTDERVSGLENALEKLQEKSKYAPQIHGILRGKYEYEPDLDKSRFEVRNARLSVEGKLPLRSEYKLEVDLCDETSIKMKDAWVRITPWKTLRVSLGQQRMPFSIDAHRNPSAQYFANRSFIAKQVGDMRDVGLLVGYDFNLKSDTNGKPGRKVASIDGGIFNGSNLDNQKTAWHSDWNYSARLQLFPVKDLVLMGSIQHQAIANRKAHYTSFDFGGYYEYKGFHIEAEYLKKHYQHNVFTDCNAVDAMLIYKQKLKSEKSFIQSISYLGRYDYMDDHSDGKDGFVVDELTGTTTNVLKTSDYARHRMTLGVTLSVRNKFFPTDIRFNYEKYWYPNGGAKESEQDKLVAELMIRF